MVAKKVYQTFPTLAELASLPQIALVDQVTPAQTLGAGTGTVLIVGETERGEFTPTQIFSDSDYVLRPHCTDSFNGECEQRDLLQRSNCWEYYGSMDWGGDYGHGQRYPYQGRCCNLHYHSQRR